jgi:hypothetical protein
MVLKTWGAFLLKTDNREAEGGGLLRLERLTERA